MFPFHVTGFSGLLRYRRDGGVDFAVI